MDRVVGVVQLAQAAVSSNHFRARLPFSLWTSLSAFPGIILSSGVDFGYRSSRRPSGEVPTLIVATGCSGSPFEPACRVLA